MKKIDTLSKIRKLYKLFYEGKIPTLAQHEVSPGLDRRSRENYLYFTLPPCINFQRSSPAMWASALKTYEDPESNFLFYPEKVIKKTREQVQSALLKHKLGLQRNKHTDIWVAISKALHELFEDDPRKLFKIANWDVLQIHKIIQIDKKKHFPYLSGPKMSNYWLYILSRYTDAKFKNMQEISIIPDTHVIQSTVRLGITKNISTPIIVAQSWKKLLSNTEIYPVQMHPVLWNWSRNNFQPKV